MILFRKLYHTMQLANQRGLKMRRRLLVYLCSLITVLLGFILLLLSLFGIFSSTQTETENLLNTKLDTYTKHIETHYSNLSAHGIRLSESLGKETETVLKNERLPFSDLKNHPEQITLLEESAFDLIRTTLPAVNCSGAFFILNTTVNPSLEKADYSRSGIYLKLANVNVSTPVNPELALFRGTPSISQSQNTNLHNQWAMEFDLREFTFFNPLLKHGGEDLKSAIFTSR